MDDERILEALQQTEVLRPPRQTLATFGTTVVRYYLVSEPAYAELTGDTSDAVVREGTVTAERPRVVTPYYMINLEGFSEAARRYFQMESQRVGSQTPGLLYSYRNEPRDPSIVSGGVQEVANRIIQDLDRRGDSLAAVLRGPDELWDLAVLKFIYELTTRSLATNVQELYARRLLDMDTQGIPRDARERIEEMFREVRRGNLDPSALKVELDRWDLFPEYEDRFLSLFRRRR